MISNGISNNGNNEQHNNRSIPFELMAQINNNHQVHNKQEFINCLMRTYTKRHKFKSTKTKVEWLENNYYKHLYAEPERKCKNNINQHQHNNRSIKKKSTSTTPLLNVTKSVNIICENKKEDIPLVVDIEHQNENKWTVINNKELKKAKNQR
jgi:hypothetical protein